MYDNFQEQDITIAIDILRGLNKKTPQENGGIDICQNWRFNKDGQISRRPVYSSYNSTSLGSNPITYLDRIYIGSNKYLIAAYDTYIKVGTDSAGTFSDLKSSLTAGLHYNGVTYKDHHYLANGTDANFRVTGLSAQTVNMGCVIPSSNPTIAMSATLSAGSNLSCANYYYKWNWEYDGYQESNVYATSFSCQTTNLSCNPYLYNFPSSTYGATHGRLYRTVAGGSIYYYHSRHTYGQLSSYLSASPYVDNLADSSLDTTVTAPTDNGILGVVKFLVLHKDRIFAAGNSSFKSRLYFSKISGIVSYPDIFPANNYLDVSPDDGDEITGLAIDPLGYLCVFKKNSIRKIFTDGDPSLWEIGESFSKNGCIAPYTIKSTPGGIIYLSHDGWRVFNGQTSNYLGGKDVVNPVIKDEIMLSRKDKCIGHYHNGLCFLSYTDRSSNVSYNNRVLIYDTITNNFIVDKKNVDSFATLGAGDDWGELYYGDSQVGKVYQEDVTINGVSYSKLSDFRPNGQLSSLVVWNTEDDPYLELGGHFTLNRMCGSSLNLLSSNLGGIYQYGFSSLPSAYSVSGYYFSPQIQLNAKRFYYAYWNEDLGDYGDIKLTFRTSNTSAGLSGAFGVSCTNPAGSDISSLTANDWLQFRVEMSAIGPSAQSLASTPRMYSKGGYALKLTYGVQGAVAESSVECDWRSGYIQLTPQLTPTRLRKIDVNHDGTEGFLSCIWDLDYDSVSGYFCIDLAQDPKTYTSPFPLTAFGKRLRMRTLYDNVNDLTIKSINVLASPQPESYL